MLALPAGDGGGGACRQRVEETSNTATGRLQVYSGRMPAYFLKARDLSATLWRSRSCCNARPDRVEKSLMEIGGPGVMSNHDLCLQRPRSQLRRAMKKIRTVRALE